MDTKSTARRHHYLPQAYLAAFTRTGSKDSQFFVLDIKNHRQFLTSPINVAVERDFNRIDIVGKPPDEIEKVLAQFEGHVATAIRNVLMNKDFPNDEDYNLILNLLGLISIRNPLNRRFIQNLREQSIHHRADLLVSDEKIWNDRVKSARKAGATFSDDVSFERMKRFIDERRYSIEFPTGGNVFAEFAAFDEVLPILGKRTWSVLVAPKDGPEFICSDHPVTLVWKNQRSGPLGYELKETEVFFPLGRRIGFYGVFEAPQRPVVNLNPDQVATMNRRVFMNAKRHVYSAMERFVM